MASLSSYSHKLLGISLLLALFVNFPTFAGQTDNFEQGQTNLNTEKRSSNGYHKEKKFVAIQVASNYVIFYPVFSNIREEAKIEYCLCNSLTEISHSEIFDDRLRLQRYIFPFHFFW